VTVLVLGGTAEARALAQLLCDNKVDFVSSLAGRVHNPRLPVGAVRIGGFGGVDGLEAYLRTRGVDAVVDATHPFAKGISANAADACRAAGIPLLRLQRPGWSDDTGGWIRVACHEEAAQVAAGGSGVFLSTGRQTLDRFVEPLRKHRVVARIVDPLDGEFPLGWTLVHARGPYTFDGECALMRKYEVDTLVTKDSGGDLTRAKLDAAAELGVRVIMVSRPAGPPGVRTTATVGEAAAWVFGPAVSRI